MTRVLCACALLAAAACASTGGPPPAPTGEGEGEGEGEGDADARAPYRAALAVLYTTDCNALAGVTAYASDDGAAANIVPCAIDQGGPRVIAWRSDLDIDCDGGRAEACTSDPTYLPETSAVTSTGAPLDASTLPFVVAPVNGHGFDFAAQGLALGNAALVVYEDRISFGVIGDRGPADIIGEASYAMAEELGIDPDPVSGGADDGALFVLFTGDARVEPIEDHAAAVALGTSLLQQLVAP